MKIRQHLFALLLVAFAAVTALAQSNPPLRVRETDNNPNVLGVNTLVFSNGSVTCTGKTCTITTGGSADVVGPASATDNALVRFDGATGKLIQNSGVILSDTNDLTGIDSLTVSQASGANAVYGAATIVTRTWAGNATFTLGGTTGILIQQNGGANVFDIETFGVTSGMLIGTRGGAHNLRFKFNGAVTGGFYSANNFHIGNENVSATPQAGTLNATGGSGSNIAGANLSLAGGIGTGTGASGSVKLQTSIVGSSGSSANTLVDRFYVNGVRKALTDASTNLFEVALPTLKGTQGTIEFEIFATNGTDVQVRRGIVQYSAVNKGGAYTSEIAVVNEAASASTGTLTATWAVTGGTDKVTISVTPAGSLTETTYYMLYTITNNSEQGVTIL